MSSAAMQPDVQFGFWPRLERSRAHSTRAVRFLASFSFAVTALSTVCVTGTVLDCQSVRTDPRWQRNDRCGRVAALYGVGADVLPTRLARLPRPGPALVLRTGYAVLGLKRVASPELSDALEIVVAQLPESLCFIPGVHGIELVPLAGNRSPGSRALLPVAGDRIRTGVSPGDSAGQTVRALVFGLALALDREQGFSRSRPFRAIHGWRRSWFGLGPAQPRDLAFSRHWIEVERPRVPDLGRARPDWVFAAAVAEFCTPGGRLDWSPLLALFVRDALNNGRFPDAAVAPDRLLFGRDTYNLRWEDGFGFRHRQAVHFGAPGQAPVSSAGIEQLARQYSGMAVAVAERGRAVESTCGHAMLLLRSADQGGEAAFGVLPDLAVTPAARVLGPRSVRRGFWGGYPSYYMVRGAEDEIEAYQLEEREVRIYPFTSALTRPERRRLVLAVLTYAPGYQGNYRFLSENCATLLANLLETALDPGRESPGRLVVRRTPFGVVRWLQNTGLLANDPDAVYPAKTRVLADRLNTLALPLAQHRQFREYLDRRRQAAILAATEQRRADRALLALVSELRNTCATPAAAHRRNTPVDMFHRALRKDLDILIKRHVDAVFYAWVADRVQAEFTAAQKPDAPPLSTVERTVALQQLYGRRAGEFMRFAQHLLVKPEKGKKTKPGKIPYQEAVRRTMERNRAFRRRRVGLAEHFFGGKFGPRRAIHLQLVDATAQLQRDF